MMLGNGCPPWAFALPLPGKPLTSFLISFVDPVLKKYFLADRDNKAIDIVDTTDNRITQSAAVFGSIGFGPNGVITVNHKEIWAGDGNSKVQVLDATGATLLHTIHTDAINPFIIGTGPTSPLCFDPRAQLVVAVNDQEKPWPWISFIPTSGPKAYTVVKTLVFDGKNGTVKATTGLEQCQWSPDTGKIYLDIPEVNGPGDFSVPGAVMVIDPKAMKVEKIFDIPLDACTSPNGMAIGPHNQILIGCGFLGKNSVIINAHTGAVEKVLKGYGGADEVWFNGGDGHYLIPVCDTACRAVPLTSSELLQIVDSEGFRADQSVVIAPSPGSNRRIHSVAADPHQNQVYLPVQATGGSPAFAGTICGSTPPVTGQTAPTNATGCILVLTTQHDDRRLVRHEREEE
jgi:hypothetical protein